MEREQVEKMEEEIEKKRKKRRWGGRTGVENKSAERQAGNGDLRRSPRWKGGRAGNPSKGEE